MYLRICKARGDAGYTREKFAELLDVSVSYLAEVERGRTNVSVKNLLKICSVLGLSADYVLLGEQRLGYSAVGEDTPGGPQIFSDVDGYDQPSACVVRRGMMGRKMPTRGENGTTGLP